LLVCAAYLIERMTVLTDDTVLPTTWEDYLASWHAVLELRTSIDCRRGQAVGQLSLHFTAQFVFYYTIHVCSTDWPRQQQSLFWPSVYIYLSALLIYDCMTARLAQVLLDGI
jgi:hypothetical protein